MSGAGTEEYHEDQDGDRDTGNQRADQGALNGSHRASAVCDEDADQFVSTHFDPCE